MTRLIFLLLLAIVLGPPALGTAQEDVRSRLESLSLREESYAYLGSGRFMSFRREPWIFVELDTAAFTPADSVLVFRGTAYRDDGRKRTMVPEAAILVGPFHRLSDPSTLLAAEIAPRLKYASDSLGRFRIAFAICSGDYVCVVMPERQDSIAEAAQAKIYEVGKLLLLQRR